MPRHPVCEPSSSAFGLGTLLDASARLGLGTLFLRSVRLVERIRGYALVARSIGATHAHILTRHLLPATLPMAFTRSL